MLIQQLTIIGVGLIGGSLARALRVAGAVGEIVGAGRDEAHLQRAKELGVIVRPVANYGMPRHLRVTLGLQEENERFLSALRKVLGR